MAELHELLGGPTTQAVTPPPGALASLPGSLTPPPSSLTPVRTGRELSDVLTRDENDRLSQSVQIGSDMAPDKTARILKAREQSGLPQAFIAQNLDEVEKQTASARFSPEKFKRENPQFASWLAKDPTNVAVARDDVQAMSAMERALWSAKTFGKSLAASLPAASAAGYGVMRAVSDVLATFEPTREGRVPAGGYEWWAREFGRRQQGQLAVAERWMGDLSQVSDTERAAYGGAKSLGQMLLTLPLILTTKSPAAALTPIGATTFGESYGRGREAGKGVFESIALAAPDTVAEVVTERFGVGGLIRDIGLKKSFMTTFRNWLVKEGLGEQAATVWQDFNEWAALNPEKPFKEFYLEQRIPRAWETFVGTVVAGGGMAAVGKSLDIAINRDRPVHQEAVFRALGEASADSKLRQRVPERFRDFVNEVTKDGPVTHVYVPVRQWNALFQENARQAATEVLGDAKQYDEALNVTEGDLVIPLGQYAEKLAGAPIHEELIPDLRFRQGDLSAREYAEIQASADDILGLQEERATAEFEAQRPIEEVRKQAYDMARQSMGESEAQRVADTYVARHQARAERLGTDPLELFDTEGPRIQRAVQPDIVVEDVGLMQGEPLERGAAKYKGIGRTLRMEGKRIVGLHPATTSTDIANLALDIENLIKQAPEGAQWYDRSGEAILRHAKGDTTLAERLAQVIAITSDGMGVKGGFTTAKKALEQYARGAPIKVGKPAVNANLNRLMYFGVPWDARKTSTFYLNIMQAMRLAPQSGESTQDRHMVRIAQERGIITEREGERISAQTYDVLEQITRAVAERMNLTPYQAQAAAWVAQKTGSLIEQWVRNKQHLKLSDQERFERARKEALVDYKHLLDAAELTPPGGMERTLAFIESTTKQIFAEVIPSQSLPAGQGAAALPFAERLALTRKILDALGSHEKLREQYRSAIGDLYGLKENQITFEIGTGAFTPEGGKPDVNPTIAIRVSSDVPKETVEQVVAAFQYVLRQDAVPYLRMDKDLAEDENAVGAVVFSTSSPLTMTQDRELYAKLAAYNPGLAFTRFEDGRYLVANFTELGSGEFYKLLYEFVEKDGPQFGITGATDYGVGDNGYPTHNWTDDPRGTGPLDQASAGRRPVVRKRLLDLHKQVAGIVSAAVERRQGAGPLYQPFDTALERNAKQIDRYMEAVDMWQDLALADDLFRYPVIKSRELKDIVRQINPKYRLVHKYSERDENGIVMFDSWAIELPVAGEVVPDLAFLTRDLNDVHIDVAGLTSGRSEGAAIYQIASTYAHNNGLVFVGDPGGITDKGMQRRVEHMLSSALKFGTTTHLRAHPKMNLPWREGDDRFNIASLVRRSYENTILDVPEVDRIVYNQQAQRFENVTNGRPITDEAFKKLATKRSAGGRAPIGSATIKRAALVNTVLREASGDVSTGRPGLLAGTGQPSDGSASSVPGGLRGIFYQPSAQRKVYRGSFIGFEAGEFPTITLFQAANPSTIIHELSHSWVEELRRDAAYAAEQLAVGVTENRANFEQLVRDWETIKGYLGVTTLREDEVIPVEAHERFARSGEAYLREGKAPSLELRGIFARFKDWLVRIYKSVTELDVELTDEVRGVFDRLLATDEQIAAAREEAGLTIQAIPLEAMTPAEAAELGRIAAEAKTEAEERVRVQLFNELIRERQDWWKNEKARVTAEVTAETDQQPVYAALGWLRSGRVPEGSPLAGAAPQKLSTEALRAVGVDIKALPPFIYQAEGGLHPDVVAEMFGFTSGQALLQELISAPPRASVIKAEVDRAMMERHGDTLNDGALAERAAEAVHGDRQADVLLAELRILTRLGAKGKVVPARAMKDLATRMVAAKTIGELRPKYYEATGARLAREAERAMITDDFDAAFTAKVRQLMNLYLFREASKKKQAIDKAIKAWRVFDRSDERLAKTRDLNLVNAGRAVLSNYGIGSTDQGPIDYLGLVAEYDPDTFADLQEKIALVTSESKPYTELTLAEFEQVKDTVDGLWSLSRQTQQMLIEGRRVSRETAREELNARIAEVGHAPQRLGYDKAISKWQAFNIKLLDWRAALRRTEHWVTAMDGASNGVFRKYIWQPITDAADSYRAARKTTLEKYLELTKTLDGRITADKIDAPELGYQFGNNGSGRAELLGALMHTGNESNLAKLLVGRGWGELQEDGTLGRSSWDAFIKRMWDTGVLTKQDYDFVQGVWDLMEAQKPAAQKAHKEMYGYYFSEVTANEVVTPFGTYRGGYFPAVVDPMLVPEGQLRDDQQALTGQQNSFMFPTTGRGFTKARAEGYRKALQLDLRYVPQHLDKVLRFTHIEPRVKEVGRLVNDKEFRAELASRVDSEVASEMLIPWLQRAATQSVETASTSRSMRALDGVFRELRSRTGAQIMVGNVTNALQQFTGLSSAAVQVKPKNLRNALFAYISGPSALAEEIAEKSAFMRNRTTAAAMEVQKEIDNILLNPTKYEKARAFATRHGYFLQTGTQNIVDIIAWRGAYSQAIEEGAEERIAIRRADSVVRQTQGTFAAEDLSRFETGSATMRAFTMFYSYFNTQANLLGTEFANVVRATGFSAPGRLFYIYIMGVMLPAVIAEAITQAMSGEMWDDDDDDGYLDTFLSIFFGGQGKFATAMVPGVGPAVMAGVNMWNDKWYDDRMSTSPVVSVLESVARTPVSVYKALSEEHDGSWKRAIKDTLTTVGIATGLPFAALGRPLGYAADVAQGRVEPANTADYIRGLISGRATQ